MSREAHIPLALWISAALVFHFAGGQGGAMVAQTVLDKRDLRALVQLERQTLRPEDKIFEVLTEDQLPTPTTSKAAAPDKDSDTSDEKVDADPDEKARPPAPPKPKKKDEKKPEPPQVASAKPPEPEKKALVPAVPVPAAPAPPPPPPDHRIAVQQHAEKNQPDNPNAPRLADDANHVAEETMARIRSHDQDMANPSAGAQKRLGPKDETGNSDKDKEAESEDRQGKDYRAPGEGARV
ncbi:MAG TPA: hypothetical protein VHB21_27170, partial [Minicystis sp.]|nr:hypothetical protein [Minicystis sp.]